MDIQSTKQQLNKRICKENSPQRAPFIMLLICVGQLSKWEADKWRLSVWFPKIHKLDSQIIK
jgi:hypothetical protein